MAIFWYHQRTLTMGDMFMSPRVAALNAGPRVTRPRFAIAEAAAPRSRANSGVSETKTAVNMITTPPDGGSNAWRNRAEIGGREPERREGAADGKERRSRAPNAPRTSHKAWWRRQGRAANKPRARDRRERCLRVVAGATTVTKRLAPILRFSSPFLFDLPVAPPIVRVRLHGCLTHPVISLRLC